MSAWTKGHYSQLGCFHHSQFRRPLHNEEQRKEPYVSMEALELAERLKSKQFIALHLVIQFANPFSTDHSLSSLSLPMLHPYAS